MKVCIPTETNKGLDAKVHGHFGSAPYFTVFDTESKGVSIIENTNAHHSHGQCHPIGVLGSTAIDVVICQGMGGRAVQKLNEANIKAFKADTAGTVADILEKYKGNELSEITVENACTQHSCH